MPRLQGNAPSQVTVKVSSDSATLLSITHSALANLLGIERDRARAKSAGDAEFVRGAIAVRMLLLVVAHRSDCRALAPRVQKPITALLSGWEGRLRLLLA